MFSKILAFIFLATYVATTQVTGVFTSLDKVEFKPYSNKDPARPYQVHWEATMSWEIQGSKIQPLDTFTLDLPCVFKFITDEPYIALTVGSTEYAHCYFQAGEVFLTFSQLNCVALSSVKDSTDAHGTVRFPFTFNAGGSSLDVDLQCSKKFTSGSNIISFYEGDKEFRYSVNFVTQLLTHTDDITFHARSIPTLNRLQTYVVAGKCTKGYTSGTLGFEMLDSSSKIDCNSYHASMSSQFNSWMMAGTAENMEMTVSCTDSVLIVEYQNIPVGYRPYLDANLAVQEGAATPMIYHNSYTCVGSRYETDNDKDHEWSKYSNSNADSEGMEVVFATSTWTGQVTQITTLPFSTGEHYTKSIIVQVPIPTVTTTTIYTGVSTYWSTITATPGETATIIEHSPTDTTTTITQCWNKDYTTSTIILDTISAIHTLEVSIPCDPEPESTEQPVMSTEESVITEEPISSEKPVTSDEPVSPKPPLLSKPPLATKPPVTISEEPVMSEDPASSEEVVTSEETIATSEEQVTSEGLIEKSEENISTSEESVPTSEESLSTSEELVTSEEPLSSEEAQSSEGSMASEEPVTSEEQFETTELPVETSEVSIKSTEEIVETSEQPIESTETIIESTEMPHESTEKSATTPEQVTESRKESIESTEKPIETSKESLVTSEEEPVESTEEYVPSTDSSRLHETTVEETNTSTDTESTYGEPKQGLLQSTEMDSESTEKYESSTESQVLSTQEPPETSSASSKSNIESTTTEIYESTPDEDSTTPDSPTSNPDSSTENDLTTESTQPIFSSEEPSQTVEQSWSELTSSESNPSAMSSTSPDLTGTLTVIITTPTPVTPDVPTGGIVTVTFTTEVNGSVIQSTTTVTNGTGQGGSAGTVTSGTGTETETRAPTSTGSSPEGQVTSAPASGNPTTAGNNQPGTGATSQAVYSTISGVVYVTETVPSVFTSPVPNPPITPEEQGTSGNPGGNGNEVTPEAEELVNNPIVSPGNETGSGAGQSDTGERVVSSSEGIVEIPVKNPDNSNSGNPNASPVANPNNPSTSGVGDNINSENNYLQVDEQGSAEPSGAGAGTPADSGSNDDNVDEQLEVDDQSSGVSGASGQGGAAQSNAGEGNQSQEVASASDGQVVPEEEQLLGNDDSNQGSQSENTGDPEGDLVSPDDEDFLGIETTLRQQYPSSSMVSVPTLAPIDNGSPHTIVQQGLLIVFSILMYIS